MVRRPVPRGLGTGGPGRLLGQRRLLLPGGVPHLERADPPRPPPRLPTCPSSRPVARSASESERLRSPQRSPAGGDGAREDAALSGRPCWSAGTPIGPATCNTSAASPARSGNATKNGDYVAKTHSAMSSAEPLPHGRPSSAGGSGVGLVTAGKALLAQSDGPSCPGIKYSEVAFPVLDLVNSREVSAGCFAFSFLTAFDRFFDPPPWRPFDKRPCAAVTSVEKIGPEIITPGHR